MITIYTDEIVGPMRPLHGVNRGPVDRNWYFDLRPWFQRWQVPNVRTHDCIYNAFDTVDLHYIFPDPEADPHAPESYQFQLSDDLLQAIRDTGAEIYFRLGETIEHQPRMMWNRPERWTPELMATVCLNIVRHYNEGWADGFHWDIRYWEFWNEPNGPKNWTGTIDQFFDLYQAVAKAIKEHNPALMVGTAGFGSGFVLPDGKISPWALMLKRCVEEQVPVDFVSWHIYMVGWDDVVKRCHDARSLLDKIGLSHAESHLGEWGNLAVLADGERRVTVFETRNIKRYDLMKQLGDRQCDHRSAAIVFGTLVALQDCPVDIAQYYCADTSSLFGLFDSFGVPAKRGWAFDAFTEFFREAKHPVRLRVEGNCSEVMALATQEGEGLRLGIASTRDHLAIPIKLLSSCGEQWKLRRVRLLDFRHNLDEIVLPEGDGSNEFQLPLGSPGVVMAEFVPASAPDVAVSGLEVNAPSYRERDGNW